MGNRISIYRPPSMRQVFAFKYPFLVLLESLKPSTAWLFAARGSGSFCLEACLAEAALCRMDDMTSSLFPF